MIPGRMPLARHTLTIVTTEGLHVRAPEEVWLGVLITTLPPEWRDEICAKVVQYCTENKDESRIIQAS